MTILIALYFAINIFRAGRYFEETKEDNEEPSIIYTWVVITILFYCITISIMYLIEKTFALCKWLSEIIVKRGGIIEDKDEWN